MLRLFPIALGLLFSLPAQAETEFKEIQDRLDRVEARYQKSLEDLEGILHKEMQEVELWHAKELSELESKREEDFQKRIYPSSRSNPRAYQKALLEFNLDYAERTHRIDTEKEVREARIQLKRQSAPLELQVTKFEEAIDTLYDLSAFEASEGADRRVLDWSVEKKLREQELKFLSQVAELREMGIQARAKNQIELKNQRIRQKHRMAYGDPDGIDVSNIVLADLQKRLQKADAELSKTEAEELKKLEAQNEAAKRVIRQNYFQSVSSKPGNYSISFN